MNNICIHVFEGDTRRYKEIRIDQKTQPQQPPNYTKYFETTARTLFKQKEKSVTKEILKKKTEPSKKPIVSFYTPTTAATKDNYADDSKRKSSKTQLINEIDCFHVL